MMNSNTLLNKYKSWSLSTRIIVGAGTVLLLFVLIFFLYGKVSNWWHDRRYEAEKTTLDKEAATQETEGDKKVGGADQLHQRLEKLEKQIPEIERQIKDANEKAEEAAKASATTRTVYRDRVRTPVRQRAAGTATDDAALRESIKRAEQAINRN